MPDIFLHSTSAVVEIVQSGKFLGSSKEMAKFGKDVSDAIDTQKTLFVQWMANDVKHSLSRIRNPQPGKVRGVLVFTDPNNKLDRSGGYPALHGKEVALTELSFRTLIVAAADLTGGITYGKQIEPYLRGIKGGPIFGFYPEDSITAPRVDEILKEAQLHGCFT